MKQLLLAMAVVSVLAAPSFSAPFAPALLKLSAPAALSYQFDGKPLSIPVTLTGTPADVSFCVFTKNKASAISKVTNGFLGWHYVSGIDTCVYVSPSNLMNTGENIITWDGKGEGGAAVSPGDYSYYLFGYDNKTPKVLASNFIKQASSWCGITIVEKDTAGKPLARPVMYRKENFGVEKWIVGNDPVDAALEEYTILSDARYLFYGGYMAVLPTDHSKFFIDSIKSEGVKVLTKWVFTPKGVAVQDSAWGKNGEYAYTGTWTANHQAGAGIVSDEKDRFFLSNADIQAPGSEAKLIVLNAADGSEIRRLDLAKWWVSQNDGKTGGQVCGGPNDISLKNGIMALGAHGTCVNSVINPYAETTDDAVLWVNRNGDYIGDHNWDPSSKLPWVCNDYNTYPYKYTTDMDDKGFVIFTAYGYNVPGNSFGLYAPDGTGVAYKNFAEETLTGDSFTNLFVDYGSAYDGIYSTNGSKKGTWFTAHDSFKGVITNQTSVAESAPVPFSVAQNSPNPFNPGTTIRFILPGAGRTTVEVYNAAGQKIETIMNANLGAGAHSVTWNAGRFSAGVYFYTIRSGEFLGTRKMTLLK